MKDIQQKMKDAITKAIEEEADRRYQEIEDQKEMVWENRDAIVRWFKAQRSWYCKKNQPGNYIRLMCRKDPQNPNVRYGWDCRLQVFVKNKFQWDIRISADAYDTFPLSPGWGEEIHNGLHYSYRIYRNPVFITDQIG